MFPNYYGHMPRVPVTGSSFYIRDILRNGDSAYSDITKLGSSDSGNYFPNYVPTSNQLAPTMLPCPPIGYSSSSYRGFPADFLDPTNTPVPLPVYIRSRSPSDIDGFSKPRRCRRSRTVFTELQLMGLEKKFETHKYLSTPDRIELAETLGLSQVQVKTWYQNRRMKWKKTVVQKGISNDSTSRQKGRPRKNSQSESTETSVNQPAATGDNFVINNHRANYLQLDSIPNNSKVT